MSDVRPPTAGELLDEINPLIGVIPLYGPPVVAVAGPWLLFALMLAGPFAVLFTLVAALVTAAAVVGLIGAILAVPFLLVRHLREYLAGHSTSYALVQPVPAYSPPAAGRALLPDSVSVAAH